MDHQVKIRGFRIELGEIEAALEQHPAVRRAVTVARQDTPGDTRLVAYVVPWEGVPPAAGELLGFLKAQLPDYMLPAALVLLDALPLTAHGKVDRRALPAPDVSRPAAESAFVAPATPVERALAAIWMRTLGINQVGVGDNFFDLGGHSLLATQVISQIRAEFAAELSLTCFFESPTIAGLAAAVEQARKSPVQSQPPGITQVSREQYRVHQVRYDE
jgi:acyl carrier protein